MTYFYLLGKIDITITPSVMYIRALLYLYLYVCMYGGRLTNMPVLSCTCFQEVGCTVMGKYGKLTWGDLVYRVWNHIGEE